MTWPWIDWRDGLPPLDIKPGRERDEEHLRFVRSMRCCMCGSAPPSDPHHVEAGGTGTKGSDYYAIPVCRECHERCEGFVIDAAEQWRAAAHVLRRAFVDRAGTGRRVK